MCIANNRIALWPDVNARQEVVGNLRATSIIYRRRFRYECPWIFENSWNLRRAVAEGALAKRFYGACKIHFSVIGIEQTMLPSEHFVS